MYEDIKKFKAKMLDLLPFTTHEGNFKDEIYINYKSLVLES